MPTLPTASGHLDPPSITATPAVIRNRIQEYIPGVPLSSIVPAGINPWKHSSRQRTAVAGSLSEIGIYDPLKVRRLPSGVLELHDGELRSSIIAQLAPDTLVPVVVTDLDDAESRQVILTHNATAGMVEPDGAKLHEALQTARAREPALRELMKRLAEKADARPALRLPDDPEGTGQQLGDGTGGPSELGQEDGRDKGGRARDRVGSHDPRLNRKAGQQDEGGGAGGDEGASGPVDRQPRDKSGAFPLAIILNLGQVRRWKAWKLKAGIKNDGAAFLAMLDRVDELDNVK